MRLATSSSTRRMIGGIEETSASCEARSAARSYPTAFKWNACPPSPESAPDPGREILALIGKPSDQRRWRINPVRTRRRSIIIISPTGPDKNRTYFVPAFTFTILIPTTVVAVSFMTTTFPALFMTPAFFAAFAPFFMILRRTGWACTFFLTFRTAWASLGFATALLSTSGCRRCKCKTCRNDGR